MSSSPADEGRDAERREQAPIAAFLRKPETYGPGVEDVEEIDTHISRVYLAGSRVYKMKRAVAFAYCDFSTLEKRRAACERELELNRRTAPELYLDVVPVRRSSGGALSLGGTQSDGEVVEWLVEQRRFDQDNLFDRLAAAGRLDAAVLTALGEEIAAFHAKAEATPDYGGAEGIAWVIQENAEEWGQWPDLFAEERAAAIDDASEKSLQRVSDALDARRDSGRVRRCHGDLHLRNIVLIDGRPRLFDAIEFNDRLACIDTLYDLAFLLMDLDHRGLRWGANLVLNRVLQIEGDLDGLRALPLFLSLRAAVRAKIEATVASGAESKSEVEAKREEAKEYFAEAEAYLRPPPARVIAVGGLSGTGKSTLARMLSPEIGPAPGAIHLRSDVIRKQLAGVGLDERLPESAYTAEQSERVYEAVCDRAARVLAAGHAVVADAVYARPEERRAIAGAAADAGVPFQGLWLEAPPSVMQQRVDGRSGDASDATAEVVRKQLDYDLGDIDWVRIDASGAPEKVAARARQAF
ncbi:MAG: AAA family ATPase [Rhodovibrionaceae bacterium]|nr:AAA family ATPase [Rhodovibrionaceae bacterium]